MSNNRVLFCPTLPWVCEFPLVCFHKLVPLDPVTHASTDPDPHLCMPEFPNFPKSLQVFPYSHTPPSKIIRLHSHLVIWLFCCTTCNNSHTSKERLDMSRRQAHFNAQAHPGWKPEASFKQIWQGIPYYVCTPFNFMQVEELWNQSSAK